MKEINEDLYTYARITDDKQARIARKFIDLKKSLRATIFNFWLVVLDLILLFISAI
jgi:hypothetical protein